VAAESPSSTRLTTFVTELFIVMVLWPRKTPKFAKTSDGRFRISHATTLSTLHNALWLLVLFVAIKK
jgi:hypothetical protein